MNNKKEAQKLSEQINDNNQDSREERQNHFAPICTNLVRKNIISQSRLRHRTKERTRVKAEYWDYQEIKKIFVLYSQHGSQWKVMQSQFPDRTANSIKNRFYTVIRTFLKLMFRYHPAIIQKLPHEIASKLILKFYEGRQQFEKFKDFGKNVLKAIDYNLDSEELKRIVDENQPQILALYQLIFDVRAEQQQESLTDKIMSKKYKSEGNCSIQKIQQEQSNRLNPRSTPIQIYKSKSDVGQTIASQNQINPVQPESSWFVFFVPFNWYY